MPEWGLQGFRAQENMQNLITFLYLEANNFKIKFLKIPFTVASIIIKYLRISLTKEMQSIYSENYKLLLKEIKEVLYK